MLKTLNIGGFNLHLCFNSYVPTRQRIVSPCSITTMVVCSMCRFFVCTCSLQLYRIGALHGMTVGKGVAVVVRICTDLGVATCALSFGNLFRKAVSGTYLLASFLCMCCPAPGLSAFQSDL